MKNNAACLTTALLHWSSPDDFLCDRLRRMVTTVRAKRAALHPNEAAVQAET